jgi:hypothetical protein
MDHLKAGLSACKVERDKFKAIVDKLPATADGVPVVPGMAVWTPVGMFNGPEAGPRKHYGLVILDDSELLGEVDEYVWTFYAKSCYSTREAAEAASADGAAKEQS